jgi:hypothetical protein
MNTRSRARSPFLSGFSTALVLVGVAWLTTRLVRRGRRGEDVSPIIDGVRPPDSVEVAVQPQAEGRSLDDEPLASEAVEVTPESQRW